MHHNPKTPRPSGRNHKRRVRLLATAVVAASIFSSTEPAGALWPEDDSLDWYRAGDGFITTYPANTSTHGPFGTVGDIGFPTAFGNTVWRPSEGRYRFDLTGDLVTDVRVTYGTSGDVPFVMDYFDPDFEGTLSNYGLALANYRPSESRFRFDLNADGRTDRSVTYGTTGDVPLVADFNDDGVPDVAVWRPSDTKFRFDYNLDGRTDRTIRYGAAGDIPFAGADFDSNSDIVTQVATYRPSDHRIRVDLDGNGITDVTRALSSYEIGETEGATLLLTLGQDYYF